MKLGILLAWFQMLSKKAENLLKELGGVNKVQTFISAYDLKESISPKGLTITFSFKGSAEFNHISITEKDLLNYSIKLSKIKDGDVLNSTDLNTVKKDMVKRKFCNLTGLYLGVDFKVKKSSTDSNTISFIVK